MYNNKFKYDEKFTAEDKKVFFLGGGGGGVARAPLWKFKFTL